MLALLTLQQARLDPGAVGLALARRWSDSGARVLFVDADTTGSRLAERLGVVERADYSPAARGLPSLVTARQPLTLESVAPHCYSMADGGLWTLFAPFHPDGGQYAAGWLAARAEELEALDRQRIVLLASSITPGDTSLDSLLQSADIVVVLARAETIEQAKELWELLRGHGLMGWGRTHRALILEGDSELDDDEVSVETGMHIVGRLPVIDDERVLRLHTGRRDRAFAQSLDEVAGRLLAVLAHDRDTHQLQLSAVACPWPAVNGSEPSPSPAANGPANGPEPSASPAANDPEPSPSPAANAPEPSPSPAAGSEPARAGLSGGIAGPSAMHMSPIPQSQGRLWG